MVGSSWSSRPAVRIALLFILGIVLASAVKGESRFLLMIVLLLIAAVVILHARKMTTSPLSLGAYHILIVFLGWYVSSVRVSQLEGEILNPRFYGERVVIDGKAMTEPQRKGSRYEMLVQTETIARQGMVQQVERGMLVHVIKSARWTNHDSLQIEDEIHCSGTLEALPGARNPGEFDYGRYLVLNGVQGFVTVRDSNSFLMRGSSKGLSVARLIGRAQKEIFGAFDRYHKTEESAYLKGVVFGYRGDLSAEVKQSFMNTGTIHILAVSGSNVVVVALIFTSMVGFLRVSKKVAMLLTFVGLLWYMVITGLSPSVIRATIMGCAVLGGSILGRKGDIYNSLAFAALVMLVWDPMYLLDVGFQLSFAAVISIVYYYPRLEPWIEEIPGKIAKTQLVKSGLQLFAVSLAAQIGTMPFTGFYFGRISIVAVVANLVVVPVSGVNVLLGFATVAFSFLNDWIASCYAALDDLLVSLLLKFVLWCSKVPFAYVETPTVGRMFTLFYCTGVTALFGLRKPRTLVVCCVVVLAAMNVVVYGNVVSHGAPSLTATVIDVGQGDSILLELPQKRAILIDTGPKISQNDSGERFIAPLLKRKGVSRLDAIILTHPHDDHIGGCKYLLENFKPRMLIIADSALPSRPYRELLATGRDLAIPIRIARKGESLQFDPTTRIFVLHAAPKSRPRDLNDQSIVLKVVYGTSSLLLTGDASERVEQELLGSGKSLLSSEALKMGHHGSSTSSSDEFLRAVRPDKALISVGRENKFKHPSPVTLSRLEAQGIETRRTDLSGALILKSTGESFRVESWRPQHVLSFF